MGAVDITLTTGSTYGRDKGALYVAKCGEAMKASSGLPVEVQFEPPDDLSVIDQVADRGIDSVGIHVESFDPEVLAVGSRPRSTAPASSGTSRPGSTQWSASARARSPPM